MAYDDSAWHATLHCIKPPRPAGYPSEWGAFTPRPWVSAGRDVTALANSYLVEYCNNHPYFGTTNGAVGHHATGGFLSQLDSQQLLSYDNLTVSGAYNDNDMLENCNEDLHDQKLTLTAAESRSQLSTFAIQSSPLILGNDLRNMSASCLAIIGNKEILALATTTRAPLVYQWPLQAWPNAKTLPGQPGTPTAGPIDIRSQVWAKLMPDKSFSVVAFNRHTEPATVEINFPKMLGLSNTTDAAVRDLWQHTDKGTYSGSYSCVEIAPHDVCALRITPVKILDGPTVMKTDDGATLSVVPMMAPPVRVMHASGMAAARAELQRGAASAALSASLASVQRQAEALAKAGATWSVVSKNLTIAGVSSHNYISIGIYNHPCNARPKGCKGYPPPNPPPPPLSNCDNQGC